MLSNSGTEGSPADREMSMPRAKVLSDVVALSGGKPAAAGSGADPDADNVAAPESDQNEKQTAAQMRIGPFQKDDFLELPRFSRAVLFTRLRAADGMPHRI